MGQKTLVESQIADSMKLLQALDAANAGPTLAVWYYYEDIEEWRLILAGPTYDALLPKQEPVAYKNLVEALTKSALASLSISDLKILQTKSPLLQALRFLVGTPPNAIMRAHFSDTTLNGIFMKEMIIMRSAI
jgi:hypothetical protein